MSEIFEICDGEIKVWIEQEAIHIRVSDLNHRDPAEMTASEARNLAEILMKMANTLDNIRRDGTDNETGSS